NIKSDLNRLVEFCESHELFLNYSKCSSVTFTRKVDTIDYVYQLQGNNLPKLQKIKDLE
ncbi:hypothetical protein HHI36_010330, partial [Cryptolaemus montrouzieri]